MYYVYIIQCKGGSFYTGSTNDIEKRFKDHLAGKGAKYTKSHKPEKLIYQEDFKTKSEALKREAKIKSLSRKGKEILVENLGNKDKGSDDKCCN